MKKRKILMDISLGNHDMSGIPQDTRWLFKLLSQIDGIDLTGWIYGRAREGLNFKFKSRNPREQILKDSLFLAAIFGSSTFGNQLLNILRPLKIFPKLKEMYDLLIKQNFRLHELKSKDFSDTIFRGYFSKGLTGSDFPLVMKNKFVGSGTPGSMMFTRIMMPSIFRQAKIDTRGYDYVIHQDSRALRCSKETQKIIRYHDMIPVFGPDLFENASSSAKYHYKSIEECVKQGAIYVTNSEPTREDLVRHFPELENRSYCVPYSISDIYTHEENFEFLTKVMRLRLSDALGDKSTAEAERFIDNLEKNYGGKSGKKFRYIMGTATIEPRKNYINLIRAYNIVRSNPKYSDVKLIICGALGWKNKEIMQTMKPFVKNGDLIYLQDVHPSELKILFSHASAFVFPTFSEGFGLPPVEAMKCGTPVISSDIRVHHWVQGDAALYVDPYSYEDIAAKILHILDHGPDSKFVKDLIDKGYKRAALYSSNVIKKQWEELFDKLEAKKEVKN